MKRTRLLFLAVLVGMLPMTLYAQLPTVKALCGEGRNVDWPRIKAEVEKEEMQQGGGPGFFYHDCDQSVTPLKASSTLANQGKYNYNMKNLNDFNPMTAWVEGKSDYGIGEYFEIKAVGVSVIYNGYQSSPKSWIENSRVKKFKVYKNNVAICYLELTDEMGRQTFELPGHHQYSPEKEYVFKFEILEVYKGTKWQDVAISEIDFALCCVSGATLIETPNEPVHLTNVEEGLTIISIDLRTGELIKTKVSKVSQQRHLSLLSIQCETKELELTPNHPLYIKNFGFCSIAKYMELNKIDQYQDLIDHIEFGVWDESKAEVRYEKLKKIVLINGDFETYSIGKLTHGNTYLSNGFITKVY